MYAHRRPSGWPITILIPVLAATAFKLPSVARGDTGPGPQKGTSNRTESPSMPQGLVGGGGIGLDGLLHSDTLHQTTTDQQGIEDLLNNAVTYALTNYPLSPQQLAKASRPLVQVPIAFSPLGIMYNIPGIKYGELRLDSACLNGIYMCSIRYWNDARIVALNPSLAQKLPRRAIVPYADDDSASTTRLLKQYVWESSTWSSDCVERKLLFYRGDSLADSVRKENFTIGYTAFASAILSMGASKSQDVGMAAIKNMNGTFIAPTKQMSYPFQAGALPASIKSQDWTLVNISATGNAGAYPLGGLVYIITSANLGLLGSSAAIAMQQLLLTFLAQPFQGNISMFGGVPLPKSQVISETKQIESLNTVPPAPAEPIPSYSVLKSRTAIIGLAVGSTVAAALVFGGALLCHFCYRRRLQMLQVTESIRAWRAELANEGLLVHYGDIQYECVPGSKTKHVVLGVGSFGKVYKANWNGTTVAVKILNNNSDTQRAAFVREANMLQYLRYPNVVSYLGCAITDHNEMMLVLEFMGGGDLAKAMAAERGGPRRFSWHVNGRFILLGIARGIAYIHSKGIIIFDVKAANVLLDEACITAKITDVGLARVMAGSSTETILRGTAVYMAPELFPSKEGSITATGISRVPVTQAVDVYSFGILMWEVLTGDRPQDYSRTLRQIRVPEECPPSMDALWKRCISRNPQQRPTAKEIADEILASI